jgi:hypothetical protein
MRVADVSTHGAFSTCAEYNGGLETFNSLAIELGFDMLSEMPAIIARRISAPPDVALAPPRPPAFSLITLANVAAQPLTKSFNSVPCLIQQLDNY